MNKRAGATRVFLQSYTSGLYPGEHQGPLGCGWRAYRSVQGGSAPEARQDGQSAAGAFGTKAFQAQSTVPFVIQRSALRGFSESAAPKARQRSFDSPSAEALAAKQKQAS